MLDMLKQTLNAMSVSAVPASGSKIYTVEILNGTSEKGLASRTAEVFESFGYEVVGTSLAAAEAEEIAVEQRPGLVMVDIMLGGTPAGIDLAVRLRRRLGCGIVFITAWTDPSRPLQLEEWDRAVIEVLLDPPQTLAMPIAGECSLEIEGPRKRHFRIKLLALPAP